MGLAERLKSFESPDVKVLPLENGKAPVIPAGKEMPIPVIIYPAQFPGPGFLPPGEELNPDSLLESTRSGFGQAGAFVKDGEAKRKYKEYLERISRGVWGPFESTIAVYNRSTQKIEIDGGFCSFYTEGPRLTGERLIESIGSLGDLDHADRPILISGIPGKDWKFIYDNGHNDKSTVVGVYLEIDFSTRRWIPERPKRKIVLPEDYVGSKEASEKIKKYMCSVPKTKDKILWVADTKSKLYLPAGVHAVLGKAVVSDVRKTELDELNKDGDKTQENSRHLKGRGKTKWEIIVEVFGSTIESESPHYVAVFFFEE